MKITLNTVIIAIVVVVGAWLTYSTVQKYMLDAKNAQG